MSRGRWELRGSRIRNTAHNSLYTARNPPMILVARRSARWRRGQTNQPAADDLQTDQVSVSMRPEIGPVLCARPLVGRVRGVQHTHGLLERTTRQ